MENSSGKVLWHKLMNPLSIYQSTLNASLGVVEPVSYGQEAKDHLSRTVNNTLLTGLTELCKKKPADPIVSSHHSLETISLNLWRFKNNLIKYLLSTNSSERD